LTCSIRKQRKNLSIMWQPGESKAEATSDPMDMHTDTVELGEAKERGMDTTGSNKNGLEKTTPQSSKKLSGTTMNMRFMQRKAEEKKQEAKRRRSAGESTARDQSVSPKRPQHTKDDGDEEDSDDDMSDDEEDDDEATFQVAGSVDMYGPQAHVLGRRSFGGFNLPMEQAMKSFHISQSSLDPNSKKPKVSDDELLKRYEDYVKNGRRREDAKQRPIGNLQNKQKRKAKSPADGKKAKRPAQR
jgi:hypothetical protein